MSEQRHQFDVVDSAEIYRGPIFAVRADQVRMPGEQIARRDIISHHGAVAVVALDDEHNVVLINQYRHAIGRRLWELPAGLLDVADEAPVDTAKRELVEEVGLAADHWQILVDIAASPGMTDEVSRIFLATELREVDQPERTHEEADMEVARVPLAEAIGRVAAGEIINNSAVAGLLATSALLAGTTVSRPATDPFLDRPRRFGGGKG